MMFHGAKRGYCLIIALTSSFSLTSLSAAAYIGPEKFRLPAELSNASEVSCNETLKAYQTAWQHRISFADVAAKCNTHQECVLKSSSENAKAYQAGASILLGLTPILLSTSAPTTAEMGLLSINRPVLAILISLGTAAISPSRVLDYTDDDPAELMGKPSLITSSLAERLRRRRGLRYLISLVEYVFLAAAVANIMLTSWTLGVNTIPSFQCQVSYLPILWTVLPLVIHITVAAGYAFVSLRRRQREGRGSLRSASGKKGWLATTKTALGREVDLSIAHSALPPGIVEKNLVLIFLYWVASVFGFVHIIVGTLFFSSLLFAQVLEAAFILIRYFASVLVCRLVLIWELEGIRYANALEKDKLNNTRDEAYKSIGGVGEVAYKGVNMSESGE